MPGPASPGRKTSRPRRTSRRPGGGSSAYAQRPWLASYPAGVPGDVEVPDVPLTRLLDDAAASWPSGETAGGRGR